MNIGFALALHRLLSGQLMMAMNIRIIIMMVIMMVMLVVAGIDISLQCHIQRAPGSVDKLFKSIKTLINTFNVTISTLAPLQSSIIE